MTATSAAHLALVLALVLIAAKAGGEVATRLKQAPVLGELAAGMIIGNLPIDALRALKTDASLEILSQLGLLILLFEVGLESTVRDVLEVGAPAARVAVLGTAGTLAMGWGAAALLLPRAGAASHLFIAAAIAPTSVGITARVIKDLGYARSREARTVLGAAVLDDIIGLVLLALVSGWLTELASGGEALTAGTVILIVGKAVGFLAVALVLGVWLTPSLFAIAAHLRAAGALLAVGLAFCLFLSWAAGVIGLAPLVGAYAAGLVLEDLHSARFVARGERSLAQLVEPISSFLVPIFFLVMGLRADLTVFAAGDAVLLSGALLLAAIVGKLAAALGAARGTGRLAIAGGMLPRGEVTLIFASLGTTLVHGGGAVVDGRVYSALVAVVIATTLLAPPAIKWSFARQ